MERLIDFHTHSAFSADSSSHPDDMVRRARERGLDGFVVTDHDSSEVATYFRRKGWLNDAGEPVDGLLILPGMEVSTADGHLLCVGIELPPMPGVPAGEVCAEIRRRGGVSIAAHPYDHWRSGIRESVLDTLAVDAIEVHNAATTSRSFNRRARAYAARRGLPGTGGSDSHRPPSLGCAHTRLVVPELTRDHVLDAVRRGDVRACEGAQGLRDMLMKHFHNFLRRDRAALLASLRE